MELSFLECTIRKHPEVCTTLIDNELVVMGPDDNIYYRINASGIKIWDFLEAPCTIKDVINYIASYYGVEQHCVFEDVQAFLVCLLEKKILCYVFGETDIK
ncbi:PqqD family protein [Legionella oakridgensis]|uniref:Coenzyme PQQ synthesis protein D (PqqD) n=1 Tax=Legionella oakridgensis TaxID=29423 RepID=A0A0W0WXL6_9GAMM|nr:PqqD family protein [Legionella oakridgensis]ETO92814.1 hypothetical protein LOR_61c14680 [Legionella oakridgensis RV-2-2007]KTD37080.1 hypothetical protein Loak_2216 [Legionella oakridgensis]STY20611.1 Uncharacterised protein [Legionella longbeachae]